MIKDLHKLLSQAKNEEKKMFNMVSDLKNSLGDLDIKEADSEYLSSLLSNALAGKKITKKEIDGRIKDILDNAS